MFINDLNIFNGDKLYFSFLFFYTIPIAVIGDHLLQWFPFFRP